VQFTICGIIQTCVNIGILTQVYMYRAPPPRRILKVAA
jgi:hypothetical protein